VRVRSLLGGVRRRALSSLYRCPISLGDRGPLVSFSFDDFPRTALTMGGAILERYGARGTYYAALGLMNTSNELGDQFRSEDLNLLLERGHELGSHTFTHISGRAVSCEKFCDDVQQGMAAIEQSTGAAARNFAYPFGAVTFASKRALDPRIAESCLTSARSIVPGCNGPEVDLNLLRANSLYGSVDRARRIEALIAENAARKAWLIFYTHDVRSNPSPYGCTPQLLEAAISSASQSGARIVTVQEVLAELGIKNGSASVPDRNQVPA
jgi:peptidoglycan/xylan/chitin deacetylase (PgdA/CDA1 family)